MARYRNERIEIKLTKEEKKELEKKAEIVGMSVSKFIRIATSSVAIVDIDTKDLKRFSYELNKVGTNINQIAKAANETGKIYDNDLNSINEKLDFLNSFIVTFYEKAKTAKGEN